MLTLELLKENYSVCRLNPNAPIPAWCQKGNFYSVTQTKDELSIVCETQYVSENIEVVESNWRIFKILGPLDFSLIGILSKLSGILADNKIGIFAVSTYNTDYILVKDVDFEKSLAVLLKAGYTVI